jgi:CubicO group peptidase (beta-lactamase class C family)
MSDYSRRAFLERVVAAAGVALLAPLTPLQAQQPRPGELAISGIAHPKLASFDALMTTFVREQQAPGAALAVTKDRRLVYARGFGWADRQRQQAVQPTALFRIASLSKPITAVAVLQLVERHQVTLDAKVWDVLTLPEPADARWKQVTITHLLQHTGGWDRDKSFDPMFRSARIAQTLNTSPPAEPQHIIRYMLGRPLDFDPGSRYARSSFGYCLLGRVIERVTGVAYERYVQQEVLAPLGVHRMRLGKTLPAQRVAEEVVYYDAQDWTGPAVVGPIGEPVPLPYGTWFLEAMDATAGWLASAVDLVRFAAAFDVPAACPILQPESIATMFARPAGPAGYEAGGTPKAVYYGCGWQVRPIGQQGHADTWHFGRLDGTSALLARRYDGKNCAVLFNTTYGPDGQQLANKIAGLLHQAVDQVQSWPTADQFPQLL